MTHLLSVFIVIVGVGWYFVAMLVGSRHRKVQGGTKHMLGAHIFFKAPLYGSGTMIKWLAPHAQAGHRKLQKTAQDKHQDWQRKKDARQ
jgi:hypothetical protein